MISSQRGAFYVFEDDCYVGGIMDGSYVEGNPDAAA
jgi:hypothetical protein